MKTYYDILEVSSSASKEVILSAYKTLSKKYHPDISKAVDALDKMQELNRARDVLTDDAKRKEYDNSINNTGNLLSRNQNFYANSLYTTVLKVRYNNNSEVSYTIVQEYDYVYISFWVKENDIFDKIKGIVKYQCGGKWIPENKHWKVHASKSIMMYSMLGLA